MASPPKTPRPSQGIPWLGLLLFAAIVFLLVWRGFRSPGGRAMPVAAGTPLPMLQVAGWLNTDAPPTRETLKGRVVVVDCWATWCPPCRAEMPHLAKIAAGYQPLGVVFIGLTPEPAGDKAKIEQFIPTVDGFDWPVGYEAGLPIDQLGVPGFPTLIAFGPDGRAVWSAHSSGDLPDVLDRLVGRGR